MKVTNEAATGVAPIAVDDNGLYFELLSIDQVETSKVASRPQTLRLH